MLAIAEVAVFSQLSIFTADSLVRPLPNFLLFPLWSSHTASNSKQYMVKQYCKQHEAFSCFSLPGKVTSWAVGSGLINPFFRRTEIHVHNFVHIM